MRSGSYLTFFCLLMFSHLIFARENFDHILEAGLKRQANLLKDSTLESIDDLGDFKEAYISELHDFTYFQTHQGGAIFDLVVLYTKKIAVFSEQDNGRDKEILNSPFKDRFFNGYQNEICLTLAKYNSSNYKINITSPHCSYVTEDSPLILHGFDNAKELFLKSEVSTVKLALEFDFLATGSETITSNKNIKINHLTPVDLNFSPELSATFRFELTLKKTLEHCEGLLELNYSQNEEKIIKFLNHNCTIN